MLLFVGAQVDGEACKLEPSVITLSLLNQATMLAKRRSGGGVRTEEAAQQSLKVTVLKINMPDYEQHHYDKELLAQAGTDDHNIYSLFESERLSVLT